MNNIIQTIRHTARTATVLLIALLAAQTAWAQTNVSNADDLEDAFRNTDVSVINVTDDITNVGYLFLYRALTINLNGHTISGDELYFDVGPGLSLTINGEGEFGSVGNIISGYADESAILNIGTVTLSHVNITTNSDCAIYGVGTLNIDDNVSFNGWTDMPFRTPNVNIIEGGNYNYDPDIYNPFANVVATVTVGGTPHYFENSDIADDYAKKTGGVVDLSWSESDDTYTIHTAAGWDAFCDLLANNAQGFFTGKTVKLGANITVSRMAGGDNHEFTGTFDGQQNTLTVSISSSDGNAAPFREIMGATIRNLKVSGSVSGHKHSAGLVSYARGADSSVENTIENCLVATDVSTIVDTDGDCYLGGIVGHGFNCKLTIRGCAFTGSLTSPHNYTGGLQGWSDGNTLILEDDIFAASSVSAANNGFHPIAFHVNNATTTATVTNVYYTVVPTCTAATRIAAAGKACYSVTAGENVTIDAIALTGDATEYNVSGITAYSGGGLQRGETLYYGIDDQLSLTLSSTGAPQGYQYAYTASAGTLSGTTLTMPDENVTISVNTAGALLSTRQPVTVAYINADGTPGEASAIALDGTETSLAAGWYFVGKDIDYTATLTLGGDVHLILADGKTMNIGTSGNRISGCGINGYISSSNKFDLTIYGQTAGTGTLSVYTTGSNYNHAVIVRNMTINGGNVTANTNDKHATALYATSDLTINGGTITATGTGWGIGIIGESNVTINGGNVTANGGFSGIDGFFYVTINSGNVTATSENGPGILTDSGNITLGCTTDTDFIYASSYGVGPGGSLNIAYGQRLYDEDGNFYSGNGVTIPAGKTLRLYGIDLADANNNNAAIANNNGKTLAVALSGRTLYKDGKWNTLCLPFALTAEQIAANADFAGATLMTLDTEKQNGFDTTGGTMYLSFKEATAIEAGVPYLVKWDKAADYDDNPSAYDIANPVFNGVTISGTVAQTIEAATDGMEAVQMVGTYSPVSVTAGDQSIMFLGTQNTLYYTTKGRDILSCRAYFAVPYIKDNAAAKVSAFTLNFNDEVTGITTTNFTNFANEAGAWYTLDGRKLSGKPTKKGMYINNGKKIVIE